MSVFQTTLNCELCMEEAVILINNQLPIGSKIIILDSHSGDPRLKLFKERKSPQFYAERIGEVFEDKILKIREVLRVILRGALDFEHYYFMLKELLYNRGWR